MLVIAQFRGACCLFVWSASDEFHEHLAFDEIVPHRGFMCVDFHILDEVDILGPVFNVL